MADKYQWQVHMNRKSRQPLPSAIRFPYEIEVHNISFPPKIRTGLWTSTYDGRFTSEWVRWCRRARYQNGFGDVYKLQVDDEARVYTVDDKFDLGWVVRRYSDNITFYWEKFFSDYDGFHVTERAICNLTWSNDVMMNLYGWDCESTVWGRWVFGDPIYIGKLVWEKGRSKLIKGEQNG